MPDPDDPFGLFSDGGQPPVGTASPDDDPFGLFSGGAPAPTRPSIPLHIQQPKPLPLPTPAPDPNAIDLGNPIPEGFTQTQQLPIAQSGPVAFGQRPVGDWATAWDRGGRTTIDPQFNQMQPAMGLGEELYLSTKRGLADTAQALRTPFVRANPFNQQVPSNVDFTAVGPGGPIFPAAPDYGEQVLKDISVEATRDMDLKGGQGTAGMITEGAIGMAPYFNPLTGAAAGAGQAIQEDKSAAGVMANALLGGLVLPGSQLPAKAATQYLRAPPVVANTLGGATAAAAGTALQGAETQFIEPVLTNSAEEKARFAQLAQDEYGAILPAAGIGGGLAGFLTALTRGRGAYRRPYDLRPTSDAPPTDVPIKPGIDPALGVERPQPPNVQEFLRGDQGPVSRVDGGLANPVPEGYQLNPQTMRIEPVVRPRPGEAPLPDLAAPLPMDYVETARQTLTSPEGLPLGSPGDFHATGPTVGRYNLPDITPGAEVRVGGESYIRPEVAGPQNPYGLPNIRPGEEIRTNGESYRRPEPMGGEGEFGLPNIRPGEEVRTGGESYLRPENAGEQNPYGLPNIRPGEEVRIGGESYRLPNTRSTEGYSDIRHQQGSEGFYAPVPKEQRTLRTELLAQLARAETPPRDKPIVKRPDPNTVDPNAVTQEIPQSEINKLRESVALDNEFKRRTEELKTRQRGENPQWVQERAARAEQARIDSTPEGRAAREADEKSLRTDRPSETATGLDTAVAPIRPDIGSESAPQPTDPVKEYMRTLSPEDRKVAREALKGWDYQADPQGAVGNLQQIVRGKAERRAKIAAKKGTPNEQIMETPTKGPETVESVPPTETAGPIGKASEAGRSDSADVTSPEQVRPAVAETKPEPDQTSVPKSLRAGNMSRKGSTIDPIDEAAKVIDKGVKTVRPIVDAAKRNTLQEFRYLGGVVKGVKRALDWDLKPLIDTVRDQGGTVGKEFEARARKANDRVDVLEGELAPDLREAMKHMTMKFPWSKGRMIGRELSQVEFNENGFGVAKSHLVAEGKEAPTPLTKDWAENLWNLTYKSGLQAERAKMGQEQPNGAIIPFKADPNRKRAIRAPTDELRYILAHPNEPDSIRFFEDVAKGNKKTREDVEEILQTSFGPRGIERPAALEQARTLEYFPTHMRTSDGRIVPLLRTNPQDMLTDLATRTPLRVAFHEAFGGENPMKGVEEFVKAGGKKEDAERLFRALNGIPEDLKFETTPGGVGEAYLRRFGATLSIIRAAKLSNAAPVNMPESFAKTLPMAGVKTYARAWARMLRHPIDAQKELENMGIMGMHYFNWHLEPGRQLEQYTRIARDILGFPLHFVEQRNVTLAGLSGLLKAQDLKQGRGNMFDRIRLRMLRFNKDEINQLMSGEAPSELYQAVATRFPEWTQGHNTRAAEGSRSVNNRLWNSLWIAHRFPRMTAERFGRALRVIKDSYNEGGKGEAAAAAALVSAMGVTSAAAGAAGLLLRLAVTGGAAAAGSSLVTGENKFKAWTDLAWDGFASNFFGPQWTVIEDPARAVLPVSVAASLAGLAMTLTDTQFPWSPYKDMYPGEAALKFVESNLAITKPVIYAAAAIGLGGRDPEMDAAVSAYWQWRRDNVSSDISFDVEKTSDFRRAMKKAARMVQNGENPAEFIKRALKASLTEKTDPTVDRSPRYWSAAEEATGQRKRQKPPTARAIQSKAFDTVYDSLRGKRLLDDLTVEQATEARKYLGAKTFERLQTYDRLLSDVAERVKEAK